MTNLKPFTTWLHITVIIFAAFFARQSNAQTEIQLLQPATWGFSALNFGQQSKVTSLQQRPGVASIQYVDFGNLANIQQNGWLELTIPGKDCTSRVKAKHVEPSGNGNYYWYGSVVKEDGTSEEECGCYDGTVNLLFSEGRISGTLKVDEDFYELHDLGENKRILVKKDYTGLNAHCGNDSNEGFQEEPEGGASDRTDSNCPVKVLALYTPAAKAALPDINGTINLTISQTNQAFRNSRVFPNDLTLVLVGIDSVLLVETNSMRNDRDSLIASSEVQSKRNAADADIVLVFVQGSFSGVLGIAGTLTLQSERAVTVINATDALYDYNTCHELAHLFACRHEPDADPTGPFEHAHCFKTGCWPFRKERNTIMYSVATGCTIQHYSNPDVSYKAKKTGVSNERENWRQLRANACTVASFRNQSNQLFQAFINGNGFGCPCDHIGMSASVACCAPGPYTYAWQKSNDGFNWSSVLSSASTFSTVLPCDEGEGVYVRLTVMSSDSQFVQAFRFFEATMTWPGQEQICFERSTHGNKMPQNNVLLTPNPNDGTFSVQAKLNLENKVGIEVHDTKGQLVFYLNENAPLGRYEKHLNLNHLVNGIYFIKVKIDSNIYSQKLVKQ